MTEAAQQQQHSDRGIAAAGWFILLLSAGSALLPLVDRTNGATLLSVMLILAGAAEVVAGTRRRETGKLAMLAGAITILAGVLFVTDHAVKFMPMLIIIMGWLFLRSLVLITACFLERGSVRRWTGVAAATDFALALIVAVGISISTLVIALFGATPPLIASFAWVLAISFIATAMLLLEIATCARTERV